MIKIYFRPNQYRQNEMIDKLFDLQRDRNIKETGSSERFSKDSVSDESRGPRLNNPRHLSQESVSSESKFIVSHSRESSFVSMDSNSKESKSSESESREAISLDLETLCGY